MRKGAVVLMLSAAAAIVLIYLSGAFNSHAARGTGTKTAGATEPAVSDTSSAVRMEVKGVSLDPTTSAPMVILVDQDERRVLPIFIGVSEATSIARQLGEMTTDRPLTHDLIMSIVGQLGGQVSRILISDVREGTYYAVLFITSNGKEVPVDSRPSDAIAVALRAGAPIFVSQKVLLDSPAVSLEDLDILTGESGRGDYVPSLGMGVQELTPDLAAAMGFERREHGALVSHVDHDGAAHEAGVKVGDLILTLNGQAVADAGAFRSATRNIKKGSASLTYLRDGKERRTNLDLGE